MKPTAKPATRPAPSSEPTEAEIQHEAHRLWLESGQVPGRDLDNWLAARELLRHHHGRTIHRRPRKAKSSAT